MRRSRDVYMTRPLVKKRGKGRLIARDAQTFKVFLTRKFFSMAVLLVNFTLLKQAVGYSIEVKVFYSIEVKV